MACGRNEKLLSMALSLELYDFHRSSKLHETHCLEMQFDFCYIYIYKCIRIRIATEVQYHLVINPSSFHISVTPMNARLMMHPAICRDFARTPIKKPSTRKSE